MMSLKPRNVDFHETWTKLKETVAAVVSLRAVERGVWNARFSDVYALCVAHPEPLADRLYDETKSFLEEHVSALAERVRGDAALDSTNHEDGFIDRYVAAWEEYSQGVSYLNCLYSYLNLQHVKRQKASDAEIIYGAAAAEETRQLEVGELGLELWERVVLGPLGAALSGRVVAALDAAAAAQSPDTADGVRRAVHSTVAVRAWAGRAPLAVYRRLVEAPYLAAAGARHAALAARLLAETDVPRYVRAALGALEREAGLARRALHASSLAPARAALERAAVGAHAARLHAEAPALLAAAAAPGAGPEARADLRRLYLLLRPLPAPALRPLADAAHEHALAAGGDAVRAALAQDEPHLHFVEAVVSFHDKYAALFAEVFEGAQVFVGALDKACSAVVNARRGAEPARAPELLARYCDAALRRRGAEADADERLGAAILVFKYVDDKDVFQKYYARALARRLIHQLAASMELEEAMINRLKAACGYEFTNKLHRMFTDVCVSADLSAKFQRESGERAFSVQVLQAGAWPLGGACAPLAPPPALERAARLFDAFYRRAFSGRRLAWLHALCTGELRLRYTPRVHSLSASTAQCCALLCFEHEDVLSEAAVRGAAALDDEAWARHLRPLLDAGLLLQRGDELALNLAWAPRRARSRLQPAPPAAPAPGPAPAPAAVDDDRHMCLQAAVVRIMKQRKVLRHAELVAEVVAQARSFAPSVPLIKKSIEALIDKQYLERTPNANDTYSYLA